MATSDVQICNLALTALGANTITDLLEDSENARKCNKVYALLREEVLREHPWSFAIKRAKLATLATAPAFQYTVAYQVPSDSLRVIELSDGDFPIDDFEMESNQILCNSSVAYVVYTLKITDASKFDAGFVTAFAARIAAELAWPITNSAGLVKEMIAAYQNKLAYAKAVDAQESGVAREQGQDQFLQARI